MNSRSTACTSWSISKIVKLFPQQVSCTYVSQGDVETTVVRRMIDRGFETVKDCRRIIDAADDTMSFLMDAVHGGEMLSRQIDRVVNHPKNADLVISLLVDEGFDGRRAQELVGKIRSLTKYDDFLRQSFLGRRSLKRQVGLLPDSILQTYIDRALLKQVKAKIDPTSYYDFVFQGIQSTEKLNKARQKAVDLFTRPVRTFIPPPEKVDEPLVNTKIHHAYEFAYPIQQLLHQHRFDDSDRPQDALFVVFLLESKFVIAWQDYDEDEWAQRHAQRISLTLAREFRNIPPSTGYLRWSHFLRRRYVGISRQTVKTFLDRQEDHQLFRRLYRPSVTYFRLAADTPGHRWHCDVAVMPRSRSNRRHILVIVDYFSKYVVTYDMPDESGRTIARQLEQWIAHVNDLIQTAPSVLVTDNGPGFIDSIFVKPLLEQHNIEHVRIRAGRPQGNGLAERTIQTLKGYLTSACERCKYSCVDRECMRECRVSGRMVDVACMNLGCWPQYLPKVTDFMNHAFHRMLKNYTPHEVLTGDADIIGKVKDSIQASLHSKTSTLTQSLLVEGDRVRLSLRVAGDGSTKNLFKNNLRKGYLHNWLGGPPLTIKSRKGNFYTVREEPYAKQRFDRNDLLKVPDDVRQFNSLQDIPRHAEETDQAPLNLYARPTGNILENRVDETFWGEIDNDDDESSEERIEFIDADETNVELEEMEPNDQSTRVFSDRYGLRQKQRRNYATLHNVGK